MVLADRDIYELLAKLTADMNETMLALRVQFQEVATKLDERHGSYDEKMAEFRNGLEGAFKRLRKIEQAHARSSTFISLMINVTTAVATALAVKLMPW